MDNPLGRSFPLPGVAAAHGGCKSARSRCWVEWLYGIPPCASANSLQIRRWALDGRRPEVPPLPQLPGPDNATFTAFADYCQLMRWAGAVCMGGPRTEVEYIVLHSS